MGRKVTRVARKNEYPYASAFTAIGFLKVLALHQWMCRVQDRLDHVRMFSALQPSFGLPRVCFPTHGRCAVSRQELQGLADSLYLADAFHAFEADSNPNLRAYQ